MVLATLSGMLFCFTWVRLAVIKPRHLDTGHAGRQCEEPSLTMCIGSNTRLKNRMKACRSLQED